MLQGVPERLDGVSDLTNREIVGRQWTRVLGGFQGIRSPGTCGGAATVRDRRLAVFGRRCRTSSVVLS